MYNFIRTIRTFMTPKNGVLTTIGIVLALTTLFAGCPVDPPAGGNTTTPGAPANLVVEFGNGQAALSWDAVTGADGYRVYRATGPNGDFELVNTNALIIVTAYTDTGLTDGTEYRYIIRAVSGGVEGSGGAERSTAQAAPVAPESFTATAGVGQVVLAWEAVSSATEYRVYRAEGTAGLTRIAAAATITELTYTDDSVANGTEYRYTVRAFNANGESRDSTARTATPLQNAIPAPENLTATAGNGTVDLAWDAVTDATEYRVFRADTVDGALVRIAETTTITELTYTDSGLANGTEYRYTVRAFNANTSVESSDSVEISATPTLPPPAAPANPAATAGNAQIVLSWGTVTGATEYRIYRAEGTAGVLARIDESTTISDLTYTDTGLTNGTLYRYTVRAFNGTTGLESSDSTEVSATPELPAVPAAPANLTATAANAQVTLAWDAVTGAIEYRIYSADTADGALTRVTTTPAVFTALTYTDTGLTNGTAYRYTVSAVNAGGESPQSTEATATPVAPAAAPTAAPANLSVTIGGDRTLSLSWDAVDGATEYYIYRSILNGPTPFRVATGETISGTTYNDTGLSNGTTYRYLVSAVNSVDEGPQSSEVSQSALAAPSAPNINFQATAVSAGVITATLGWTGAGSNITEHRIYRANTPTGELVRQASSETITARRYSDATLASGVTYRYVVRSVNAAGEGPASAEVMIVAPTLLAAPANFTATPGDGRINLSWDAVTSATEYRVYRYDGFSANAFVREGVATGTTYTDTPVTNGEEYRYIVRAYDGTNEGQNSSEVTATPAVPVPAVPANLTATAGDGQVVLSWEAAAGATRYYVLSADTPSGILIRVQATITTTSFTHTGRRNGDAYRYVVRGVNRLGAQSANSNEVSVIPVGDTSALPAAPANLRATATASTVVGVSAQVVLTWDAVTDATEYQVYRGVTGGTLTRIGLENPLSSGLNRITTNTFTDDTGLENGTAYRYAVRAVNAAGVGAQSTEVTATPTSVVTIPAVPTSLSGNAGLNAGNASVTLTWTAGARASEYNIYRSDSSTGPLTRIATTARITATTYTDFLLTGGTAYRYAVRSVNVAGESADSNIATVTALTAISAPENLSGTVGTGQVELSWDAVAGATGYRVYRAPDSLYRTLTRVANSVTGTTYTDSGLTGGTTYWYIVRAVSATGESTNSNEIRVLVPSAPAVPASPSATAGDTLVSLSWTAVDNATEYRIYRSATSTGSLTQIAGTNITGTVYTDTGLTNGTAYRYAVRAVNVAGESANSTVVNITPNTISSAPSDPRNLAGTPGNAQVTLSWDPVRGASEYRVFRSAVASGLLERIDENTTIAATTYTDTALTNTTTYRYSVRASNSSGQSLESIIISVTPDDHGNSQATATTLTPGTTVTGNIGPAGDSDFFAIPISTNRVENVMLTATTTGPGGTTGRIFGRPRIGIGTQSWEDQNGNTPLDVSTTITETGTYYLSVNGTAGNYSLTVTAVAVPAFDDDHGNTGITATPITSGTAVSGILGTFDDDFFSIEVTGASAGSPVTITVTTTGTEGARGNIHNELNGEVNGLGSHGASASPVSLTSPSLTENGVYYIQLSASTTPIGSYTLTATVQ